MAIRKRTWKNSDGSETTRWFLDLYDANGNRERRQFNTRKEAEAERISTESQMRGGSFRADAAKFTVKLAADSFLVWCDGRHERGERMTTQNLKTMEGHIRNYICPDPTRHEGKVRHKKLREFEGGIGSIKLSQLTARSVGDFRDRLRNAGVGVVTTRKIISTLHQILSHAVSRDMVAINAAHGVKVIGRRDEGARKILPPTKEAMRALLGVADQDFRVKLAFASSTGVRAGELHALRWHHVNFTKGEVKIETRVDAYHEEDVTKTVAGMRTIPLSQPLLLMLKEWKLRTKRKKAEYQVSLLRTHWPNHGGRWT